MIVFYRQDGWTPLHMAIKLGNDDLVNLLLLRGADINAVVEVSHVTYS